MNSKDDAFWGAITHFKPAEFGPKPGNVSYALIRLLQRIRVASGMRVIIHCTWAEDGHSTGSYHYAIPCEACDFHLAPVLLPDGTSGPRLTVMEQYALLSSYQEIGGLGFYPDWSRGPGWHIDRRAGSQREQWVRRGESDYRYGPQAVATALRERELMELGKAA